ncbi:MAG: insulinase family protein [Campylobacter sp.]|nr:insulinase family protein [Campylobacter sp.]
MIKFSKTKLKNKLEIYHIPVNRGSKVISVDIFYKVGSRNEVMGKSGIAHMLEHLNFKSSKNLKAGEFDKIVKGFGGVNNASTGFDYTHYFIKCSRENLEKSLGLFAELMQNLSLKDKEFQPERDVVAEERRWRTDNNPMGYLFYRLFNHAFIYHPYHWTPIGFMGDIQTWSIDDIKDFHETYYQPQNAILLISGDIDKKSAFELAKQAFGDIENKKAVPKVLCKEPPQDGAKRAVIYKDSQTQMLAIAYKIPPFNHPDSFGIGVMGDFLTSGKSSLLQKVLVEEKQLANSISAFDLSGIDENLFIILATCNPGVNAEVVEAEILKILNDIKTKAINKNEILRVKNIVKSAFLLSFESASKSANIIGDFLARGDIKPLYEYEDNIEKINEKMLKHTAKTYFVEKNSTTLILKKDEK